MTAPYYSDDLVTLYHGDCREVTEWLAADVLVTDPPYGVAWTTGQMDSGRAPKVETIAGDEDATVRDDAMALWGTGRPAVVFGSWRVARPVGRIAHRLIWHKATRKPGFSTAPWFPNDEEVYVIGAGFRGSPAGTVITTREQRDGANGEVARIGHPTPKPIPLMEWLVSKCPEGTVADPFAGSGATLLACRNLGVPVIGVEVREDYCELIAGRMAQDVLDLGVLS